MKRIVLCMLLLTMVATAHAEKWVKLSESVDSDILMADEERFEIKKYFKNNVPTIRAMAPMVVLREKKKSIVFITVIDAEECVVKNSGELINIYPSTKQTPTTSGKFYWSDSGNRISDTAGKWLCNKVNQRIDNYEKEPKHLQNKNNRKLMM